MTKRQAIDKAQQLANDERRTFIVMAGDRRSYVYPLSDLDYPFVASSSAVVVPPQGTHSGRSAAEIVAQEARR